MKERKKVHFVGIGGVGMSGIAKILMRLGYEVSGSDAKESAELENLRSLGAKIYVGHREENLGDAEVLVYSSAITIENPEVLLARQMKIPVLARGEMLAELMRKKQSIAVAGAHGKTTTTALITTILSASGYDPTTVIGGKLRSIGTNARMGTDEWFVCESDESDGSFLKLFPTIAVVTNIDREHLNHYGTFEKIEEAFLDFSNRVPFDGVVVVCLDDPYAAILVEKTRRTVMTYGIETDADVVAKNIVTTNTGMKYTLIHKGIVLGDVELPLKGKHNILNSLAAAAVGLHLGLTASQIAKGLSQFEGIERRLEVKGEVKGIRVIDDYAHHPTEIRASIDALRMTVGGGALRIVFQPHRFTRVRDLWDRFVSAFDGVDDLILLPIYAASEAQIKGITSDRLVQEINKTRSVPTVLATSIEDACAKLASKAQPGDLLVSMGAGDVTRCGAILLTQLTRIKSLEVVR